MKYVVRHVLFLCYVTLMVHGMDFPDITPPAGGTIYESLADLKEKASKTNISFIHHLSEFTYSKLNKVTLEFYKAHGNLVDSSGRPAPHVTIMDNFAIDLKSELPWSRLGNLRLGQNLETKELIIFKPLFCDTDEISLLKENGDYKGEIPNIDPSYLSNQAHLLNAENIGTTRLVGMPLVDGVTFNEMNKILPKINLHGRNLVTYNFIQELQRFINLTLWQQDNNAGNFMITAHLDVKIIDFGAVSKDSWNSQLAGIPITWFDQLFSRGDQSRFSPKPNIKNYFEGTFGNLFEKIDQERKSFQIIAYSLCKECPKLS